MGCQGSKPEGFDPQRSDWNKAIEQQLRQDARKIKQTIKMLLLGAGDTGKSTFLKQLNILHGTGIIDTVTSNKMLVNQNIVSALQALIFGCETLEIPLSPDHKKALTRLAQFRVTEIIPPQYLEDAQKLWSDPGIRAIVPRAHEITINPNFLYFIENAVQLSSPDYIPTEHDLLLCRSKTIGIAESTFGYKEQTFVIVDVGGQRSERRKWIHCFENVNFLLFFASLGEYDQKLEEDPRVSRLSESMRLFGEIINSKWFAAIPVALILNKRDILAEKIKARDLSMIFPEYDAGLNSYDEAVKFISTKFTQLAPPNRELYVHVTCATDSNCIRQVFDELAWHTLHRSFADAGL